MTRKTKQWLLIASGMFLLLLLLIRSIRHNPEWRAFHWSAFLAGLVSVDKGWAALALAAIYATYLVRALRWRVLMRQMKPHPRLWNLLSATVIGFAAIGIFGRAGEMVRPYLVARKEGVSLSGQVGVWLVERCFDTLTLLIAAAFALSSFDAAGLRDSPSLIQLLHVGGRLVAFSTLAVVILLAGLRNFAEPVGAWLIRRARRLFSGTRANTIEHGILAFVDGTRSIRSLSTLGLCTLYSAAEWILIAWCYAAVFNSFSGGIRLEISQLLIFMGCVMLGSMINIPGIGGGIQVASLLVLTELFGLRPEVATGIALLIWVFTFLAVVPPALLLMLYEGLSWSKLRRMESDNGRIEP